LLGQPLEVTEFLCIAILLANAIRRVHERGLIHKDIKPANILVDAANGGVWLTGFGIASRLLASIGSPEPPEVIAGTLASRARCPSPPPIRWNGFTATSRDSRCHPANG
jgi:serine/threonine protein kinase